MKRYCSQKSSYQGNKQPKQGLVWVEADITLNKNWRLNTLSRGQEEPHHHEEKEDEEGVGQLVPEAPGPPAGDGQAVDGVVHGEADEEREEGRVHVRSELEEGSEPGSWPRSGSGFRWTWPLAFTFT